jgi:hypothetical protein
VAEFHGLPFWRPFAAGRTQAAYRPSSFPRGFDPPLIKAPGESERTIFSLGGEKSFVKSGATVNNEEL